nr:deoxyhypusine synthase family protein [Nostoc sp. KVJ20]
MDRIYDTYIDEDQLRVCDMTIAEIAENLEKRPYSSREFIEQIAVYLERQGNYGQSVVQAAYQHQVPIFVPAFSDCSAGFGLVHHQWNSPESHLTVPHSPLPFMDSNPSSDKSGKFVYIS